MITDLYNLLRSGHVRRWHQNPDMCDCGEKNAQHQWETTLIALTIEPTLTAAEIIHALTHDAGEMRAGDLSFDFKRDNPLIASAHGEYEHGCRLELVRGLGPIRATAINVIKAADILAARHTMLRHEPWLRHRSEWKAQAREAIKMLDHEQCKRIEPWFDELDRWCDERGV